MDHTNIPGITPGHGVPQDELDPRLIQREKEEHNLVHDEYHPHHTKNHDVKQHNETNHPHMVAIKEKVKGLFNKDKEDHHAPIHSHTAGVTTDAHPTTLQHNTTSSNSSSSDSSIGNGIKDHTSRQTGLKQNTSHAAASNINHHREEAGLMAAAGSVGVPSATGVGIEHHEREHGHSGVHQYPGDHFPAEIDHHQGVNKMSINSQAVHGKNLHSSEPQLGVGGVPVETSELKPQTGRVSNYNVHPDTQGVFEGAYPAINSSNQQTTHNMNQVENIANQFPVGNSARHERSSDGSNVLESTYPATNNLAQPTVPSAASPSKYNTPVGNVEIGGNQPQYAPHDYSDGQRVVSSNILNQR